MISVFLHIWLTSIPAVLLFVFWYCHKRGKETRLARAEGEKSAATSDVEVSDVETSPEIQAKEKEGGAESKQEKSNENAGEAQSQQEADAKLDNMPSVLDLPEPQSVSLPDEAGSKQKEAPLQEQPRE